MCTGKGRCVSQGTVVGWVVRVLGPVSTSSGPGAGFIRHVFFFSEKREKIIIMMMGQTGVVDSDTKMKADQQATRSGRQLAGRWTARWLALDVDD